MEDNDGRFYWWAIPKTFIDAHPQALQLDAASFTDYLSLIKGSPFLIIPYDVLGEVIRSKNIPLSQVYSIPLEVLPGKIDHNNISSQLLNRPYGQLHVSRDLKQPSQQTRFELRTDLTIPASADVSSCFPAPDAKKTSGNKAKRFLTAFSEFPILEEDTNLFVARVPEELSAQHHSIIEWLNSAQSVWTAGMQTLRKLSALGVKVNGTVDSTGERELHHPLIQNLYGKKWLKLTYQSDAPETLSTPSSFSFPAFFWYQLQAAPFEEGFAQKTHFFWMSITSYLHALKLFPDLSSKFHASGLGATYDFFSKHLPAGHYQPFYSIDEWRTHILK